MHQDPDRMGDLIAAVRLAERSLSMLVDDIEEVRDHVRADHESIVRLQEQLQQVRDQIARDQQVAVQTRGQAVQATATVIAGAIGAASGIASLLWQILRH